MRFAHHHQRRLAAAVAASALLFTISPASGATKKKPAKKTAPTTTTAAAPTTASAATIAPSTVAAKKSTLVIGMPIGITGSGADGQKSSVNVAAAWEAWVNDTGGINGHPVKIIVADVKGDPATAQSVAKDMVENGKIIAAVGAVDSATETVYQKVFVDAKIPVIGGTCYSTSVTCGKIAGIFNVTTSVPAIVAVQIVSAKAVGARVFGAAVCAEIAACAASEPLYKPVAESFGLTYGGLVKVGFASPDYTAECLTLKSKGVDYVQISAAATVGERLAADCSRQGYDPFYGASGGTVNEAILGPISKAGSRPVFAGGLQAFPWWVNDAPVKNYRAVMDKYAKGKEYRDATSSGTWASLELFRKAMAKVGDSPTSADVFTAMYNLKDENLDGLLPQKMTYPKDQPSPPVNCFFLYKLSLGQMEAVSGGLKPSCFPPAS